MKLTSEQIDQLFSFTRQHYVEWYDLQSELVDHLANAIETQWEENPKLTFDQALNAEFKKFGVFGFMDVVEKRQAVLSKKYNRLVWEHFKDFFGIPKIVLLIAMTLGLFSILKINFYSQWIFIGLYLILIVFSFREMFKNSKRKKQQIKEVQKRWLFEEIINQYGSFSVIALTPLNIFIQLLNHSKDILSNPYYTLGLSFLFVLFAIIVFIIFKIMPAKAEDYLLATYPEYKLDRL
ncbi:hypothetical protein [Flavobacterium degerlachei]|jgi:hypothetical protein|uniref:Uncharacterized protein n=1 Tax=Flavobacterium degerlachei TaxID=229203 RepID=A0A1H2QYR0_9FLAO|nr:hypothetical protein [Flavobacterium degerlachei]SDW12326.1 hypothetical protein SAMN05444338_101294 [Flavobacterium degerlachei]